MSIFARPIQHFSLAKQINWNSGLVGGLPRMASTAVGFYKNNGASPSMFATVVPVASLLGSPQNIQENRCLPATFRCNVPRGTALLLADNGPWAPIHIEFTGAGVTSLGSYAVARWDPAAPPVGYTASLYVRLLGSGSNDWIPASAEQGFTGDIFSSINPSFAPFVGCEATAGDRIIAARFDVGHAQDGSFSPVGITNLDFYV
jgi:hypothetical protein